MPSNQTPRITNRMYQTSPDVTLRLSAIFQDAHEAARSAVKQREEEQRREWPLVKNLRLDAYTL